MAGPRLTYRQLLRAARDRPPWPGKRFWASTSAAPVIHEFADFALNHPHRPLAPIAGERFTDLMQVEYLGDDRSGGIRGSPVTSSRRKRLRVETEPDR